MARGDKRGRPRKNGMRHPSGQPVYVPTRDNGTPEGQARRDYLASLERDRARSWPLGALWANGAISNREFAAGKAYARARSVALGRAIPQAVDWLGPRGRAVDDAYDEEDMATALYDWRLAQVALDAAGAGIRDAIDDLIVHARWPRFMAPIIPTWSDCEHGERILRGLRALEKSFASTPNIAYRKTSSDNSRRKAGHVPRG